MNRLTNDQLLKWDQLGLIPGPLESEEEFLERISLYQKLFHDPKTFFADQNQKPPCPLDLRMKKPHWSWVRTQLLQLFSFAPEELTVFHSNKGLSFLQGAVTWIFPVKNIKVPFIQLRKQFFFKRSFLKIYSLEEILAHESVHAARIAFEEPLFEEFFAYLTSSSSFRKIFGPIIRREWEGTVFLVLLSLTLLFQGMSLFESFFSKIFLLFGWGTFLWLFLGCTRLFRIRWIFSKAFRHLFSIFHDKKKTFSFLFRLTDEEVVQFSRFSKEKIFSWMEENKEKSLRHRLLFCLWNARTNS